MLKDVNFDLVGSLIAKLREKYGLSQQEFAKEIGVSKGAVCQWEQGAGIKTENLYDIARYFNITVSELIDGQLFEEEDEDYFERNYNLDDFEYFVILPWPFLQKENASPLVEQEEQNSNNKQYRREDNKRHQ